MRHYRERKDMENLSRPERRIGCIGAGHWGKNLVRNFYNLGALAAVCECDGSRLTSLQSDYPGARVTADVNEIMADRTIAGVAIATPAESHGRMVREALLADKDVMVE